jgi:hypothetical protein
VYTPDLRRIISSWQSLVFGSPRFFHPRWFMPVLSPSQLPLGWTSFALCSWIVPPTAERAEHSMLGTAFPEFRSLQKLLTGRNLGHGV